MSKHRYDKQLTEQKSLKCRRVLADNASLRHALIVVLIATQLMMPSVLAQASQVCYNDAKKAYEYLIKTEEQQASEAQARIDEAWVNINTASEAQLTTLSGIGSIKAQEIILYRDTFGAFDSVDNLTEVRGIGEKTVEKNRHRLRVD